VQQYFVRLGITCQTYPLLKRIISDQVGKH
jgi:hypothetical protein